jgi:putative phosphoesterase
LRIAVIADIHGNLQALDAVRSDLRKQSPDLVVNLGDHLSGPLQAAATADVLMGEPWLHIRGNHDRQLVDRPVENMGASDRAAYAQLEDRHKRWLQGLPPAMRIEPEILLCHGSPSDDLQYLLEEVGEHSVSLAAPELISERLGATGAMLILCGHSHIPRAVRHRAMQIINPGSVGLQAYDDIQPWTHYVETGSPHARYAILDQEPSGGWRVSLIALDYHWRPVADEARRAGRPDWAHALETGYALRFRDRIRPA